MGRRLLEESIVISKETGYQFGIALSLSVLGRFAAIQADYVAARSLYEQSLAIAHKMNYKLLFLSCVEELAGVVAAQGEPAWAARLLGAAEAMRDTLGSSIPPIYRSSYEYWVTIVRRQLGEGVFTLIWAEGRTMTPEQALLVQGPARLLEQETAEVQSTAEKTSPPYPADLTEREVEVLRLVAQGLTNPQIAEHLIVSPHTVNAHMRSIFNKLGVSSRSAVTRFAIEHKLV
jgi:ATP/maltotriose-dependent transcriptional regulator MalT